MAMTMATETELTTEAIHTMTLHGGEEMTVPTLPKGILNGLPKLSVEQAGHLRHFHNLASQMDGGDVLLPCFASPILTFYRVGTYGNARACSRVFRRIPLSVGCDDICNRSSSLPPPSSYTFYVLDALRKAD